MGCHTWAYRKFKQDEIDVIKQTMLVDLKHTDYSPDDHFDDDYIEKEIKLYRSLAKDEPQGGEIWKRAYDKDYLIKYLTRESKKRRELIDNINKCCDIESLIPYVKKWQRFTISVDLKIVDGWIYKEIGFDEPCRIYGYYEDHFTDVDEFIGWIKKKESNGKVISRLYVHDERNYIDGMCNEMEKAIRDYWNKYDNNVYVEFG